MDYILNGILTSVFVGLGIPSIGAYLYYAYLGKNLNLALAKAFSSAGVPSDIAAGAVSSMGTQFIWLLVVTAISLANLVLLSFLLSYYQEASN
jgi:hypothetical protein